LDFYYINIIYQNFNKDCGRSFYNNNIENKIIGGVDAVPHSWPSIVALFSKDSTGWSHLCGGTLIDNKTVLTAAQ
jgi:secreted trypsin-like serine protease